MSSPSQLGSLNNYGPINKLAILNCPSKEDERCSEFLKLLIWLVFWQSEFFRQTCSFVSFMFNAYSKQSVAYKKFNVLIMQDTNNLLAKLIKQPIRDRTAV